MPPRIRLIRLLIVPVVLLALVTGPRLDEESLAGVLLASAGIFLVVLAAGGRVWASLYVAGKKNDTLVTDGPFSMVRNPLYFFSLIGFVGAGFAFGSATLAFGFAVVFFLTHWPTIHAEEKNLLGVFGPVYERYRASVPRFIPNFGDLDLGDTVPVNPRNFARALRDCMAIPLVLIVVEVVKWAQAASLLPVLIVLP
jgi:protein-S-isoprenylcysteine O-methyltransferase Ste14